jgi:hypothetical protein
MSYLCAECGSKFSASEFSSVDGEEEWEELAASKFLFWGPHESHSEGVVHVAVSCPGKKVPTSPKADSGSSDSQSFSDFSLEECSGSVTFAVEFDITAQGSETTDEPEILEASFSVIDLRVTDELPEESISSSADEFERVVWKDIELEEEQESQRYYEEQEAYIKKQQMLTEHVGQLNSAYEALREHDEVERLEQEAALKAEQMELENVERQIAAHVARVEKLREFVGTWMPGENRLHAKEPQHVLRNVFGASEVSIVVFIYTFTDQEIARALAGACRARNVLVRVVADAEQTRKANDDRQRKLLSDLRASGCSVFLGIGKAGGVMHLKSSYVDHILKINGCYNWTWSAANKNVEELEVALRSKAEIEDLIKRSENQCILSAFGRDDGEPRMKRNK